MKCDLLHRKNSADSSNTRKKSSVLEIDPNEKDVTINALHSQTNTYTNTTSTEHRSSSTDSTPSDPGIGARITENMRHLVMSTTNFPEGQPTVVIKEEETKKESKVEEKLIKETPPEPPVVKETKEDRFVNAMTRLSRLNTDLANERNLLAWGRTAMAAARTFLAFINTEAITNFGKTSREVCYLGFGVMSIYIILQGAERYNKIKKIVYLKNPPPNFDRLTNAPLPICLALLFALGLMSVSFDQWEN